MKLKFVCTCLIDLKNLLSFFLNKGRQLEISLGLKALQQTLVAVSIEQMCSVQYLFKVETRKLWTATIYDRTQRQTV